MVFHKSSEWLKQYHTSHTYVCRAKNVNPVAVSKAGIEDFVCAVVEEHVREWRFMDEVNLNKFKEKYTNALV